MSKSKGQRQVESNIANLWHEFKSSGNAASRDQIIEYYAHLVKLVAGRLAMHLPSYVDFDDLLGFGALGLLDAVDRFQLDRGIKFETYASMRIKGAMLDGLRSIDWSPRSIRNKARQVEQKISELENKLGRSPEGDEIAASLDMPLEKYHHLLEQIRLTSIMSLDEVINPDSSEDPVKLLDTVSDPNAKTDAPMLEEELLGDMAAALEDLNERERLVITLYYYEQLTLKEIGSVLDVSESRVCQIHTKAILTLRSKLMSDQS